MASFELGVNAVGRLIEQGLELLDGYRREQEAVQGRLRNALTLVGSLRRKDFDGIMGRILAFQLSRESEIKTLIRESLKKQRGLAARLKHSLEAGIFQEVERCKEGLSRLIDEAREEIFAFQREQEKIRSALEALEANTLVSAREFKKVIGDLETELFGADNKQVAAMGNG
ncbi:MAG: hypothetical protein HYU97_08150 [Deltaproteobacteria bacterium]|nr:hypothetical protein [Deltaproteobacteria bacterium]